MDEKSARRRYIFEVGLRLKSHENSGRSFTFNGPILYMFPKMSQLVEQNNPLKLYESMLLNLRKKKVLSFEQYTKMIVLFKQEVTRLDSFHKALVNLSSTGSTFRTSMKAVCSEKAWVELRFNWGKPISNVIPGLKEKHLFLMSSLCEALNDMVGGSCSDMDLLDALNDSKLIRRVSWVINEHIGKPIPDKRFTLKGVFSGTPVEAFGHFMDTHIMGKEELEALEVISSVFRCMEEGLDLDQWMAYWYAIVFLNDGERGLRAMWSDVGPLKTNNTRDELVHNYFPYRAIDSGAAAVKRKRPLENEVNKK